MIAIHGLGATAGAATTADPRLVHAAHQFEAQMMKELLEPMTNRDALLGEEDSEDNGGSVLGQFASEALAGALSEQGGFGIADRIVDELSRTGNRSGSSQVTAKMQNDTKMSTPK